MKNILTVVLTMILVPLSVFMVLWVANLIGVNPSELQGSGFQLKPANLVVAYLFVGLQFLFIWFCHRVIIGKPLSKLGFQKSRWLTMFIQGIIFGFTIKLLAYGANILFAKDFTLIWAVPSNVPTIEIAGYYVYYLIFLLTLNSFIEELVYRAFPLENIYSDKTTISPIFIVIAVGLLFALVHHILEPFTWTVFISRFLFGVLAGQLYIQHRNIWLPIGLHNGWNWIGTSFTGYWKTGGLLKLEVLGSEVSKILVTNVLLTVIILFILLRNLNLTRIKRE